MKLLKYILVLNFLFVATTTTHALETEGVMNRIQLADKKYEELFAEERKSNPTDPEFMDILQKFIFGEVFYIGKLDDKTRELITIVSLTTIQALPQLKPHINAALNVGNTPLEIREAIYQSAPFIGFPRTLNALSVFNEVMREKEISLPLEDSTTVNEENRYLRGLEIQDNLYGDEVKNAMRTLPPEYQIAVPNVLTNFCFGDFYTRKGLTVKQRELLTLVGLASLGAEKQLKAHIIGNLKAGNDKNMLLAAMVQIIPYVGLPNALTAINQIKESEPENYKPIYE